MYITSLAVSFKGCVRYFWTYNNVQVVVIIISCILQNIYHTKLPCFHFQQHPSRFSCVYRSCLALSLRIFNPEIIEANTILKKNVIAGFILMTYGNALTRARSYWKYSILIITPCKRFRINEWNLFLQNILLNSFMLIKYICSEDFICWYNG